MSRPTPTQRKRPPIKAAITQDDCDVLIPLERHMARICLIACIAVVLGGIGVISVGVTISPDVITALGGSAVLTAGLLPFRTYYNHEQNRVLLVQIKHALGRGVVLPDLTVRQVNKILAGRAQ